MPNARLQLAHGAVHWWKPSRDRENLGDFLSRYLLEGLFSEPRIKADIYCLIGSVITRERIEKSCQTPSAHAGFRIAFWCCGCRDETGLPPDLRSHAIILGARGPLTAGVLGLPRDTPIGDPALLLPLIYTPQISAKTAGKTLFIPHVYQALKFSETDLLLRSGADVMLSPLVNSTAGDVEDFIDQLCSSSFILTSSLHGAIIAAAYGVPFSFFDCGFVDVPFKWRDFSASAGFGTYFPRTVDQARAVYEQLIRDYIQLPPLAPILDVAPFSARNEVKSRALAHKW